MRGFVQTTQEGLLVGHTLMRRITTYTAEVIFVFFVSFSVLLFACIVFSSGPVRSSLGCVFRRKERERSSSFSIACTDWIDRQPEETVGLSWDLAENGSQRRLVHSGESSEFSSRRRKQDS